MKRKGKRMQQCKTHFDKSHGGSAQIIVAIARYPPLLKWGVIFFFLSISVGKRREGQGKKGRQEKMTRSRTAAHGPCWLVYPVFSFPFPLCLSCVPLQKKKEGYLPFPFLRAILFLLVGQGSFAPWSGMGQGGRRPWQSITPLTSNNGRYSVLTILPLFICSNGLLSIGSIVHQRGHLAHF